MTRWGDSVAVFLLGWIVPVGDAIHDRRGLGFGFDLGVVAGGRRQAALGETHSQAALGNDTVDRGLRFFQKIWAGAGERVELRDYDTHILLTHIRAFLRAFLRAHIRAHIRAWLRE